MTYPFAAVLFDMDGTIINNVPLHQQVWREFTEQHGLRLSDEELAYAEGRKAIEVVAHYFGGVSTADEIGTLTEERQVLYRERLATASADVVHPITGVEAYLAGLGNLGIARVLATDAPLANVEAVFEKFSFASYFDEVVASDHIQHGKPDPQVFLAAARRAGVSPDRCLVAEDSRAGVAAAKAAGCRCLGLITTQSEQDLWREGADFVVKDYLSLPAGISLDR
jgi:HAD superfamily hydrolase (TIGR01509 family)